MSLEQLNIGFASSSPSRIMASHSRPLLPIASRAASQAATRGPQEIGPRRSNGLLSGRNSIDGKVRPSSAILSIIEHNFSLHRTMSGAKSKSAPGVLDEEEDKEYDEVVVGVGCAAAYHVNALHENPEAAKARLQKTLFIGQSNAWTNEVRGAGVMNHQKELLAQWGPEAPPFDPRYTARLDIAEDMEAQVDRAIKDGASQAKDHVVAISKGRDGAYLIRTVGGTLIKTSKVIVAPGLGPHIDLMDAVRKPFHARSEAQKRLANISVPHPERVATQVFNIDQFTREIAKNPERFRGKTLAVHGANAAWSAAELCGKLNINIHWMVRSDAPGPVFPDGHQLAYAPRLAENLMLVDTLTIEPGKEEGTLEMTGQAPDPSTKEIKVTKFVADYYVYAFGQDIDAPTAPRKILGDLVNALEPVYDKNQHYSDRPWETVLALRDKGATDDKGLTIIGAAVNSLANLVPHNYVEKAAKDLCEVLVNAHIEAKQIKSLLYDLLHGVEAEEAVVSEWAKDVHDHVSPEKLRAIRSQIDRLIEAKKQLAGKPNVSAEYMHQTVNEVASVYLGGQLAMVRGSVAAMHSYIPPYIKEGGVNFSADDRTMLAVYVAHNHPHVSAAFSDAFVAQTLKIRRMTQNELRLAAADKILLGWDNFRTREQGSGEDYLRSVGIEGHGDVAKILDTGLLQESIHASNLAAVANALRLEGIPVLGMPESVRQRYRAVLEEAKGDDDPSMAMLKSWLSRTGKNAEIVPEGFVATSAPQHIKQHRAKGTRGSLREV